MRSVTVELVVHLPAREQMLRGSEGAAVGARGLQEAGEPNKKRRG